MRWISRLAWAVLLGSATPLAAVRITEPQSVDPGTQQVFVDRYGTLHWVAGSFMYRKYQDGPLESLNLASQGATALKSVVVTANGMRWATEPSSGRVYHVSATGTQGYMAFFGEPTGICVGPDGYVWVTEYSANKVTRITLQFTEDQYTIPTLASQPVAIIAGPDGNLWFTEYSGNKLGRITPGGVINEFNLPTAGAFPKGLAANEFYIAVTEPGQSKIAFFDVSQQTFPYVRSTPTTSSAPESIALGADGSFWFVEALGNKIGRFGSILVDPIELPIPTAASNPSCIAAGTRSDLWFVEKDGLKIGRIELVAPGDVNGDGNVNVADVFYLINFLFAGGSAPK